MLFTCDDLPHCGGHHDLLARLDHGDAGSWPRARAHSGGQRPNAGPSARPRGGQQSWLDVGAHCRDPGTSWLRTETYWQRLSPYLRHCRVRWCLCCQIHWDNLSRGGTGGGWRVFWTHFDENFFLIHWVKTLLLIRLDHTSATFVFWRLGCCCCTVSVYCGQQAVSQSELRYLIVCL